MSRETKNTFKRGQILFTRQGVNVTFDHLHDGLAYVAPTVKVEYYLDGGETYEEGCEPSEALIAVAVADLFISPPVDLISAEIAEKQAELADIKAQLSKTVRESERAVRASQQELSQAKRELDRWMHEHQHISDIGRLLDGEDMFPLNVEVNSYHKSYSVPRVPRQRDIEYIKLTHSSYEQDTPWRLKSRHTTSDHSIAVRFFQTEVEREAFVSGLFEEACGAFRKNPKYETTSYTTGTTLHFGTLGEWVGRFEFLSIPQDILEGKSANDALEVQQEKQRLIDKIAEMEGQS